MSEKTSKRLLGKNEIQADRHLPYIAFQSTILLLGTRSYSSETMDVEFKNLSKYWLRGIRGNYVVVSLPANGVYFVNVGILNNGENSEGS